MSTAVPTPVTPERIMQFAWGYVPPLVLEAAIRHRVFDLLDSGPKTISQVHKETGASERGLSAVMHALVGMNFLSKDKQGVFSLTPESSAFLVSTKPGFLGGFLRHGSEQLIPKWLHLNKIVETGNPVTSVNQEGAGSDFFAQFVNDIFPMSYPAAQTLTRHLSESGMSGPVRVLDLAAGSGVWGIAMAQGSEKVSVTAVDWPEVIPITRKTVSRFGLAERYSFVAGDLLQADFGTGHTVATLGHILHSEGRERSRELLKKTVKALASGGIIVVAEFLVNADRTGPLNGLFFALNMLVNTDSGDTYSFEEISSWLKDAGFVNARTLDSPGPSPLVLATKP
ncbi:MAG TPA: methyltransferase [Acidobacteriaceae bacterium]|nr:methyltransferase [Acidobacteriaceae bacterium]